METKDFSQRGEQKNILAYFGDKTDGRFLDIGAADGKTFSTTHALALRGWGGICVEPNPHMLVPLLELYDKRDDIIIIAMAASTTPRGVSTPNIVMWITNDFVSSSDPIHVKTWSAQGVKFRKAEVGNFPLDRLTDYILPLDMINIDVEGNNLGILRAVPKNVMDTCQLLCIEHEMQDVAIKAHCASYGLKPIHRTEENLLLAR